MLKKMLGVWLVAAPLLVACAAATTEPGPVFVTPSPTPAPAPAADLLFKDVSQQTGVTFEHRAPPDDPAIWGTGAAFADYDRDGHLDLYVTNRVGPNVLYHNNGDGTFVDLAEQAGVAAAGDDSAGVTFADYDNDGWRDLYLLNFGPNRLYHNNGDGTFTEVTAGAGVGDPGRGTSAAWGDYDNDGFLDLYVANHVGCADYTDKLACFNDSYPEVNRDRLYHNNGDGTFSEVTTLLGPTQTVGAGFAVCFFDYNDDGRPDIYLVNDKKFATGDMDIVPADKIDQFSFIPRHNLLWRNDGPDGTGGWQFTEVAETTGTAVSAFGMGLAVGDYDNDGQLDLYFSDIGPATLLRNLGNGTFEDVTDQAKAGYGLGGEKAMSWGAVFFDFDNDGWLDIYLGAMGLQAQTTVLFQNKGDGTFADISAISGAADNRGARTVAVADYDGDGFLDLFVVNYGRPAGLYRNLARARDQHWLAVELVGTRSNRDAIGAKIRLTTPAGRPQLRTVRSGDSLGAGSDLTVHFGLGQNEQGSRLDITWPSGLQQTLSGVMADQRLVITEPTE